ncbi:MAG: glycosyltransferase [Pseudomonadota bacterium]
MNADFLKKLVKSSSVCQAINANLKSQALIRKYRSICRKYESLPESSLHDSEVSWKADLPKGAIPKILWIGADKSQDFTGFYQDLSSDFDCKYFTRSDGSYGQYPWLGGSDDVRELNLLRLEELLSDFKLNGWEPDYILTQCWGFSFNTQDFLKLKSKSKFKLINISMDDRLNFVEYSRKLGAEVGLLEFGKICDLVLTTTKEASHWYHCEGVRAMYLPLASSTEFYHPLEVVKRYDVGFIGNCYGYRKTLVEFLQRSGISIVAHGKGWPDGMLQFVDNNKFFNECKIVLGIGTVGHTKNFFTLKLRDFDAPMSGACYVTHHNEDLLEFFEPNKEIVLCKNANDFLNKINYYLKHPEEREKIATAARKRALADHQYRQRFKSIFK